MSAAPEYIEVAVALPVYRTYTYSLPEAFSAASVLGRRVLVPFRRRRVTGFALGPAEPDSRYTIKHILDVLDEQPLFGDNMFPFFKWLATYYMHPLGEVIKSALPAGMTVSDYAELSITESGRRAAEEGSASPLQGSILDLLKKGNCPQKELRRRIGKQVPAAAIDRMVKSGWIARQSKLRAGGTREAVVRHVEVIRRDLPDDRFLEVRRKILDAVESRGSVPIAGLLKEVPEAKGYLKFLQSAGFVKITERKMVRDPFGEPILPDRPPVLNQEQQDAVTGILSKLGSGYYTYLLSGVTGSGKTEVYLRIAEEAMGRGFSVLVLVPEIALISQTERRFRARFGECVAVLHSGLSSGERYDQWVRIQKEEVKVVIGARSAVFAPVNGLGVIVVDEEHDNSYKQEKGMRYNARDVAVVRASLQGCIAVLGSATPSIQSSYNAAGRKFNLLQLTKRVNRRPLPEIAVVDLRKEKDQRGVRRFVTPLLQKAIEETLERGEQTLLFLNRRGYANFPVCAACGETLRCKNCDISLTLHKGVNAYKCHFCGYSKASVSVCEKCGHHGIKPLGLGTERVESAVSSLFPEARVARMDRDTTTRKGAILKILKELRKGKIDILVGTQMIAKGHDFPGITLVGVICADLSLNFPDFRAGEQTFQLLAQVAGRAGRGDRPGRVILQTYTPDHFCITAASAQDHDRFYQEEIRFRQALGYPPFSRMIQLKISGRSREKTKEAAMALGEVCRHMREDGVEVLGPIEAPLAKLANRFRWQILLKARSVQQLHRFVRRLLFSGENGGIGNQDVKVAIDVDPVYMM